MSEKKSLKGFFACVLIACDSVVGVPLMVTVPEPLLSGCWGEARLRRRATIASTIGQSYWLAQPQPLLGPRVLPLKPISGPIAMPMMLHQASL